MILIALALLAPAAAAEDEPIELFDTQVGGYRVHGLLGFAPIYSPNPGTPGVGVDSDAGSVPVASVDLVPPSFCTADDAVVDFVGRPDLRDAVFPCERTVVYDVTQPCEANMQQLRDAEPTGDSLADSTLGALDAADGAAATALASAPAGTPRPSWDGRARALAAECEGSTPPATAGNAIDPSEVILEIQNPYICPRPDNPVTCPGFVDIDDQVRSETVGTHDRLTTQECNVDGFDMSCGAIPVGEEEVDPLAVGAAIRGVFEEVFPSGRVELESEHLNYTLDPVHLDGMVIDTAGVASCTASGVPGAADGRTDAFPFVLVDVTPRNRTLPEGVQTPVVVALGNLSAASSTTMMLILNTWASTVNPPILALGHDAEDAVWSVIPALGSDNVHQESSNAPTTCTIVGVTV